MQLTVRIIKMKAIVARSAHCPQSPQNNKEKNGELPRSCRFNQFPVQFAASMATGTLIQRRSGAVLLDFPDEPLY
jgi:hypothetical protein